MTKISVVTPKERLAIYEEYWNIYFRVDHI